MAKSEDSPAQSEGDEAKKAKNQAKPKATTKRSAVVNTRSQKSEVKPEAQSTAIGIKTAPKSEDGDVQKRASVSGEKLAAKAHAVMGPDGSETRKTILKFAGVIVGLILVLVVVFGVLIYGYKSENPVVQAAAQVIPYPVEQVNGQFVSVKDYYFEVNANEKAYQYNAKLNNQTPVDFNTASGKKLAVQIKQHTLQQLQSEVIVAQLANQKKVVVTQSEINSLVNQLYQRYGGKATLLKTLNQIYGWNLSDLEGVIRKQLLQQNLEAKITSDPSLQAAAKSKAETILTQVNNGADFTTLAKQNSQASDASNGGNLGYFTKGQVPDNEWDAAEALQPGSVSGVIQTQYGYEILKVLDKKSDGSIEAQHILIEPVDFNTYLQQQINKAKVSVYLKS